MKTRLILWASILLSALPLGAQSSRELLRPLDPGQVRRLEDYNRVFLQEELYSAARYRIVSFEADLLMDDGVITITPFPDVKPVVITPERIHRTDAAVNWFGRIEANDATLERFGVKYYAPVTMLWWDVDADGNATLSGSNQFKFSPAWKIDANDKPVRSVTGNAVQPDDIGPPPETPAEIAEHKRLLRLDRHAVGSLDVRLELPTGETFVVVPLRYTPKYSVVYEVDKSKIVPIPFEEENVRALTNEERAKIERYDTFRRGLTSENKAVRGDLQ